MYDGELVGAIRRLKHGQIEPLGNRFALQLAAVVLREGDEVLIAGYRQRARERRFSQVDAFDRPLFAALAPPLPADSPARWKPHLPCNEERSEAVRAVFAMRKGRWVDNLRILLLDDVMTTGAMLDACSHSLLQAGAKSVLGLTIAGPASL